MKPTVYIETTIPSLLTGRTSRDLQVAAQQEATQNWWATRRFSFDLFASEEVLLEAFARRRRNRQNATHCA